MGKYPNKGMNALAKKNPKVAKKIMGYADGGMAELSKVEKLMDTNKDGKVSPKEKQDYFDMMESDRTRGVKPMRMRDGGYVKGYRDGGMAVKGKKCPHRGKVRGTGIAMGGAKFTGTR